MATIVEIHLATGTRRIEPRAVEERILLFDAYDVWVRPEPATKPGYRFWSWLLFVLLAVGGCATFGGLVEEQRTDATLAPYLRHVRYTGSAERLTRLVLDDLHQHERWHREHNLIHRINVAAGQPTATIVATPKALDALGPLLASGTPVEATDAEPFRVEFRSVRETYVLSELRDGFVVAVRNRGDGDRLFHRELAFLRRADPSRAERLREKILAEHPEVVLDPWQE